MQTVHRSGKQHLNADALSCDIADTCQNYSTNVRIEDLPCGGCRYFRRAHERWHEFNTEIDDVIPLSQGFQELPVSGQVTPLGRVTDRSCSQPGYCVGRRGSCANDSRCPGVPSFEIAVSGVTRFKPKIEEQWTRICKLTHGDSVNGGISLSSYSSADIGS